MTAAIGTRLFRVGPDGHIALAACETCPALIAALESLLAHDAAMPRDGADAPAHVEDCPGSNADAYPCTCGIRAWTAEWDRRAAAALAVIAAAKTAAT